MPKKFKQALKSYSNVNKVLRRNLMLEAKAKRDIEAYKKLSFDELYEISQTISAEYKAVLSLIDEKIEKDPLEDSVRVTLKDTGEFHNSLKIEDTDEIDTTVYIEKE